MEIIGEKKNSKLSEKRNKNISTAETDSVGYCENVIRCGGES